jgi:Fe-S-cluster containining protein
VTDPEPDHLSAGAFAPWLAAVGAAIRGEGDSEVPCGTCTACCTSSQFVHVGPDETETLAHIPPALLFAAPRMPDGHRLMGYDRDGRCPMLVDEKCSIYEHRPRTCRTYDCRVFPAAAIELNEPEKAGIARQARRWRFSYPTARDRVEHDAVRAAARHLLGGGNHGGPEPSPAATTQLAVTAVRIHRRFLADP